MKVCALFAYLLFGAMLFAQAPKPSGPVMHGIFDNERVRVWEVVWPPGSSTAAVKQEGADTLGVVAVVLKGGTLEYTSAKGVKTSHERKPGEVLWQAGNSQIEARQSVGKTPLDMIQARIKKAPPSKEYSGPVEGARKVLDNASAAVFDETLAPAQKLPMHKYGPRVWVVLEGGEMRSTDKAGKQQAARLGTSQVVWLTAQEQELENTGKTPVRIISIELK